MAANYTDTYSGIERGRHIVAADVVNALNTKEKVEHKISTAEWTANKTSETKYPSCAAVSTAISELTIALIQVISEMSKDTAIPSAQRVYSIVSGLTSGWQTTDNKVRSYEWAGDNASDIKYPTCGAVSKAISDTKLTPVTYIYDGVSATQPPTAAAVWNLFKDLYYA
jgi:hypothetical protein